MAETIRDLLGAAKERGFTADQTRTRFREKYGQELDDYQDKLDTTLEQVEAFKPAPEPKAVGIAGAPKMEFPAAREFGKELTTGKTGKGLAIGEAIGAAFGAPTAGATIGAGIGKLLEPEPEVKTKPTTAARIETARAGAALGGALFGGPGALAGAALGAKFPAEEAAKYRGYEDFETQLKYLKATTPELREPVKAKEELEVEEPVIGVTRARRPKSRLTKSEAEKLAKWSSTDINEPPSAEVISMYQRVKGEDPRDVGALRKFRTEQAQEHQVGAFTPTEFKWAAPWDVARRATGALTGLARTGLGETKLTQRLEEPEVPDPDQPRPADVDTSGMRMLDPAAQAESEQRKYQQRLWDEMQKDAKLAEKARRQWAPVYASRKARGAPLYGEGLPSVIDWPWLETPSLPGAPGTTLPDPDLPRPKEGSTGEKMYWDLMQRDPKVAEEARQEWALVYAAREARGQPRIQKDILPERFRPFVEQVETERKERQATTPQSVLYNFGLDLTTTLAATADMANKLIGAEPVPETPEVSTARAQLEKAKKSGDEDAIDEAESNLERISQEAIGAGLGMGLGGLPGQFTGLAGGLLDLSGRNVLLTHPFTSLSMAAPAFKSLQAASPKFNNAVKAIKTNTANFIGAAIDYVFPGVRKSIKQKLVQYLANAIEVGDKERTAILDDIVVDPSRIKAMGEVLIRDAKSGKVPGLKDTELVEVELKYTPEPDVQAAKAAERKAAETGARAEAMGQAKEMAVESAQNIQKLNSNIRKLKKKAESVQKRIVDAATESDKAALRKRLAELQMLQRTEESRLAVETRESQLRGKAKIASEEAMERGVELAEELQPMGKVTRGMQKKLEILDYKPEDIKKMSFAQAKEILERAGEKVSVRAEPRTMMTKSMREQLNQLGYTNQMIEKWKPAYAEQVLREAAEKTKEPKVVSFVTESGDDYSVDASGAATKIKTKFGKLKNELRETKPTFYVSKEDAAKLQEIKSRDKKGKLVFAKVPDQPGAYGIRYTKGPKAGKFVPESIIQQASEPVVGSVPIELTEEGRVGTIGSPVLNVTKETKIETPRPVSRITKKAGEDILSSLSEAERRQRAADEIRIRGLQEEERLRQKAKETEARLEEQERAAAGRAAVAGVEMAEGVKGIEDTEAAAQAARRAAAAPARFVAGAERAAKAAAAAAETAGERPEVSLGRIWVPREKLTSAETTLASEVPVIRAIDPRSAEYLPRMMEEAQYRLKKAKDAYENPASVPNPERLPLSILQESLKQDVLKAFDLVEQVQKAIDEQRTGEYRVFEEGGPRRLARLFEEVPATRRRAIEELAVKASDYKRQALEAGFDPNAPISAEAAKRIGVPEDATVYTAARRLAEHIDTIHADPTLVAEFLRQERLKAGGERAATKAGIAEAARWINAEIEAQNAATMIEPTYGAVRRPTPVVEAHELGVGGDVIAREEGKTQSLARALKPLTPGEELPTAEMNTLDRILDQMAEYSTKREAPKSVSVENTRFSQFMKEYADMVRQIGSTGEEIPAPRFDLETPDRPVPGEPFINRWAKRELEAGRKLITPERIYQQILNTVLNDTVQLTLNSQKFRDYLMDLVDKRIKEAGFTGAERKKALIEVNKLISDPLRLSQHSKEKFPVVSHNGKPILKVDDFIQAAEKLDPKIVNEARANTIAATVEEQSRAAATYGTLHNIESEMNRFRFDADGKPRTLPNGAQAATRSAEGYAAQLAQSVVRNGETFPLITPYSGETIAQALRIILNDADKDYRFNWNAQERQRLRELIDDVGRFESAQNAPKSKLVDSINGIFERTFKGTETKPVDFHNVHMHPAVLKALDSHFQDLLASETLDNLTSTLVGLTKAAQRNVVPMNVASLVNNNLSNTLLQFLTRGSVDFLPNMVEATFKYTKFLEGDYQGLTPAEVRKFKAINRNAPVGHTQYANEITKSSWWQELKREKGLDVTKAGRMLKAAPEAFGKLRDAMTDMYSKYGDIPFRLEEMSHVYDKLNEKIDTLEIGSSIDVEVTRNRNVRITKLSENKFQINDMTGRQKPQIVGREDQMLADVLGANANVLQNRKMLNPRELGLWGKALQRAGLPLVSGIFTWYQGAMDIPFLKRGLVHELLFGGPFYETTSPAIMKMQAMEYAGKALKRAITINSAQAAFLDQRKLRNVRHSLGYNPSLEATVLADASNPAYASIRNLDPLMFGTPTVNTLNGIANLFETGRFTPAFNDPLFYAKTMNADLDWANMSDKQIDSYPPEVAKYGRELKELSKTDPKAYEDRALIQRDLIRWGSGQISDVGQFFQTLGLAGGPLLNWLMKTKENKWSFEEGARKFLELVIGVTPARAIDVAAGVLGEAGVETAGRYSSYGTDLARSGFHSKSETTPDESTLLDWALRQLLGIGWKQAFYGTGKEKADDIRGVPMLKSYIKRFSDAMNDSFKNSLRRDARKVLGANATDEQVEEQAKKTPYFDLMNKGLKNTVQKTLMTLNQGKAALDESRREYPAPSE